MKGKMGVDRRALEALLYLSRHHNFDRTAMIGRHGMPLKPRTLKRIFGLHGYQLTEEDTRKICSAKYAEPLLKYLGATSVDSVDASDYQDANLIADLSKPVPPEWLGRFDTVIDAGTIEHIYNFPQAVENCLGMLKPGGFYMCLTCGNSYSGHGFYQISPELWFSLFSSNHFADIEVFLVPTRPEPPWFKVADPHAIKGRVEVINGEQTFVLAFARKTDRTPRSLVQPQQSDYEQLLWKGEAAIPRVKRSWSVQLARGLRSLLGNTVKFFGRRAVPAFGLSDHPHLEAFDPAADKPPHRYS
jgi:SAM-dependent methyltransferase